MDATNDDGVPLRPTVERATRFTVGAVEGLLDLAGGILGSAGDPSAADPHPPQRSRLEDSPAGIPPAGDPSAGDLVVGVALATQARLLDAAESAVRAAGRVAPFGRWVADFPLVRPGVGAVGRHLDDLARRGAAERVHGQALVATTVEGAVGTAVGSELLSATVDEVVAELLPGILEAALPSVLAQIGEQPELLLPLIEKLLEPILASVLPDVLDRLADQPELLVPVIDALLGPILDTALPEVLDKLNEEPEVVRELVLGQSVSIAGEMTDVVRARGAVADDLIERVARKLTFRKPRAELPHAPRALASGEPQR